MRGFSRRFLLPRIALSAVTLLLALGAFEAVCRLLEVDFSPNPNWRYHGTLGWTHERSKVFKGRHEAQELTLQFNALGFRDIDHQVPKPKGVKRIVILGDSFSEALQVNLEETYWRQLQAMLNGASSGPWEVINLGVGDFGTLQGLLALREYGLDYEPDIVISQIFPLNDICNNTLELAGLCKSRNDRYRPYARFTSQGMKLAYWQPMRHKLRQSLVSFGVLERAYLQFWVRDTGLVDEAQHQARLAERGIAGDPLLNTLALDEDQIEPVRKGWRITERLLQETADQCRRRDIAWMGVVIPFHARISTAFPNFQRSYPRVPISRNYPELRLRRLFRRLDAPAVMALEAFDQFPHLALPPRDGHLNPQAHRLAAEAIHRAMAANGWIEAPRNAGRISRLRAKRGRELANKGARLRSSEKKGLVN